MAIRGSRNNSCIPGYPWRIHSLLGNFFVSFAVPAHSRMSRVPKSIDVTSWYGMCPHPGGYWTRCGIMKSSSSLGGKVASLRLVHCNPWLLLGILSSLQQSLAIRCSRSNSSLCLVSLAPSLAIQHVMARQLLTAAPQDRLSEAQTCRWHAKLLHGNTRTLNGTSLICPPAGEAAIRACNNTAPQNAPR